MAALEKEGHATPTPIQARAIPTVLAGHDVLGVAQTGSGKTAAFALPVLHQLFENPGRRGAGGENRVTGPRALALSPTRELADQIRERFSVYGARTSIPVGLVVGGASIGKQKAMLRRGVDILVATPGRLEDLLAQNAVSLDQVEMLVLDEVDQMLDMGFINAIRRICAGLPKTRQSIFFSATMPREIARLANALLKDPVRIEIEATARPKIAQSAQHMPKGEKPAALVNIVKSEAFASGLVFVRTKRGADRVAKRLNAEGVRAEAIHGNRSQGQRDRALKAFKRGEAKVLVATDIAARGIDVPGVSHVVNFDLPNTPETYVHRIGRTARAGASGVAVSFWDSEERAELRAIEKLTGERFGSDQGSDGAAETRAQNGARRRGGRGDHHGEARGGPARGPGNRPRRGSAKRNARPADAPEQGSESRQGGEQLSERPSRERQDRLRQGREGQGRGRDDRKPGTGETGRPAAKKNVPPKPRRGADKSEAPSAGDSAAPRIRRRRRRKAA